MHRILKMKEMKTEVDWRCREDPDGGTGGPAIT